MKYLEDDLNKLPKITKEQMIKERSKDLEKYYKIVKTCSNCGIKYGLDIKKETEYNLCPYCSLSKPKRKVGE